MKRQLHLELTNDPIAQPIARAFAPCDHGKREDRFVSGRLTMA